MPLGPYFTQLFTISYTQFGLLVSAYTLAGGVSGLLASVFMDRFGRKRLLLSFLYGMLALFTLAFGLASTYGSFMLAHICAGTFGGVMLALVQTIVGDVMLFECSWPSDGHCDDIFLGIHRCGGDDGSFTAVRWGWHLPFIGIGCFSLIFIVFAIVSLPVLNAHLLRGNSQSPWQRIRETLADNNQKTKPLAR